jgi:hypothetical protein
MKTQSNGRGSLRDDFPREVMLTPEDGSAMVRLYQLGWGTKRIAGELGCSRTTAKRYIAAGG